MPLKFKIHADWSDHKGRKPYIDYAPRFKQIKSVVIGGRCYNKPTTSDSVKIRKYYDFIIDNIRSVTELNLRNKTTFYLYNSKLHSYEGYCYVCGNDGFNIPGSLSTDFYAIHGKIIHEKDFKILSRLGKVQKLIKSI